MRSRHSREAVTASQLGLVLGRAFSRSFLPKGTLGAKIILMIAVKQAGPEGMGEGGVRISTRSLLPH